MTQTAPTTKRERVTREILRHVDIIMAAKDLDVAAMSDELREFLKPLSLKQIKAVVLAAAKSDAAFWDKFGGAMELMLVDGAKVPEGGDREGLGNLAGQALQQARDDLNEKLIRGMRFLKGGAAA